MKIMFFIYSLAGGGAERVMTNLANHWASRGRDVSIVSLAPVKCEEYPLNPTVKRISLDLATESASLIQALSMNVRRVLALRRCLKEIQPDVAIAFMTTANVTLGFAALGLPIVALGSERNHPPMLDPGRLWGTLSKYTYGNLAAITALTQETAAWLQANTNARRVPVISNMAMWPLPIQEPVIDPAGIVGKGRHVLLAAGRLSSQKGFDLLIDTFGRLAVRHPTWDLVIVGEGPEGEALRQRIESQALIERVKLIGRVGNLRNWYERAAIFVLSSRFEGYPGVLSEALVHGVPVVSFDCDTGPRDIIRPEVDGILVPNGDVAALERALDRLMSDPELRNRFQSQAVAGRERFSVERVGAGWEALFAELGVRQ